MAGNFEPDPLAQVALANSAEMGQFLLGVAELGAGVARDIAPVGDAADDPHSGKFRDSIHAELAVADGQQAGLIASDDEAFIAIEFGTADTPPHATLRRAAEAIGLDLRGGPSL